MRPFRVYTYGVLLAMPYSSDITTEGLAMTRIKETRSEAQANQWMAQQALKASPVAAWAVPSRLQRRAKRVNLLSRVLSLLSLSV